MSWSGGHENFLYEKHWTWDNFDCSYRWNIPHSADFFECGLNKSKKLWGLCMLLSQHNDASIYAFEYTVWISRMILFENRRPTDNAKHGGLVSCQSNPFHCMPLIFFYDMVSHFKKLELDAMFGDCISIILLALYCKWPSEGLRNGELPNLPDMDGGSDVGLEFGELSDMSAMAACCCGDVLELLPFVLIPIMFMSLIMSRSAFEFGIVSYDCDRWLSSLYKIIRCWILFNWLRKSWFSISHIFNRFFRVSFSVVKPCFICNRNQFKIDKSQIYWGSHSIYLLHFALDLVVTLLQLLVVGVMQLLHVGNQTFLAVHRFDIHFNFITNATVYRFDLIATVSGSTINSRKWIQCIENVSICWGLGQTYLQKFLINCSPWLSK